MRQHESRLNQGTWVYDKLHFFAPNYPKRGFSNFSLLLAPFREWGKTGKEKNLNGCNLSYIQEHKHRENYS